MNIPVIVKAVSEIVPEARVDTDRVTVSGKIESCFECGALLRYVVTRRVEGCKYATDTEFYCAVCGTHLGGIYNDPFDEILKGDESEATKLDTEDEVDMYDDYISWTEIDPGMEQDESSA